LKKICAKSWLEVSEKNGAKTGRYAEPQDSRHKMPEVTGMKTGG
jgi:hypothetical protein